MIDFDSEKHCFECKVPCFAKNIDQNGLLLLNQNKSVIHYSAGQVISKQGSFAPNLIYLVDGLAKIIIEGKNSRNTLISIVKPGNYLAIPIFESQKKHVYTSIALTDCCICEINEPGIRSLINGNLELSDYLLGKFYNFQVFLMNRLHLINTRNNHGKLAAGLLYLQSFSTPETPVFEYITRKDLAELSAISIESVNKIIQELKNDRIIDITPKGIVLTHINLIEKLSNIG